MIVEEWSDLFPFAQGVMPWQAILGKIGEIGDLFSFTRWHFKTEYSVTIVIS